MSPDRVSPAASGDLPIGVLTVDTSLVVRTWSAWLETATGITAGSAQGRPLGEVVPEIATRGLLSHFERVAATGEAQVLAPAFHKYLIPCDPLTPSEHFTRMQQLVTLGPLRENERIVGVMATIEDVTARLEAERTLAQDLRSDNAAVRERAAALLHRVEALHQPGAFVDVLRTEDWQVRRTAVEGLARHASRDLLTSLIETLRAEHRDFNVLASALQLLAMIDVDVTEPLSALLRDPDPDLRIQAALALGEHPGPVSGTALIEALADEDLNVRFHAIESLGRLQWSDAVEPLAAMAETRDFFLAFPAVDALSRIADPRVAPRLVPLLDDDALAVPVAEALGRLGGGEVVRPLVAVLDRDRAPVTAVASAITTLHEQYERRYGGGEYIVSEVQQALTPKGAQRILDAVSDASDDDLRTLVQVLSWIQNPAVERALTRLLGRPELRGDVLEALVRRGATVVSVLVDQLGSDDREVQLAAISALGRLGDARATDALAQMLGSDRTLTVAAAGALAHIGDPKAFDRLFALLTEPDAAVRQAAIGALNSIGHPGMGSRVAELLAGDNPRGRESAARIAGYFGYTECAERLLACCEDQDEAVRRAALEQVPFLVEGRAVPILARALGHDTPRARGAAAAALGRVEGDEARAALHASLADPDPWVRYFGARALAQHRHASSLDALAALADGDPAPHVRIAAVEAIGAIDGPLATPLLVPYANGSDPSLAAAALAALGKVRDGSALAPLLAALRSPDAAIRLAAVGGLSERADIEGAAALSWTAAADTEDAVALAAVQGLGRVAAFDDASGETAAAALLDLCAIHTRRETAIAALARVPVRLASRIVAGFAHPAPEVRRATVEALMRMKAQPASARVREALGHDDPVVREAAIAALDRVGARGLAAVFARMAEQDPAIAVRRAAAAAVRRDGGSAGS